MTKRKFTIKVVGEAIIELDDKVISQVDDEWRGVFYNLHTPEEIAEMIGRCMMVYKSSLSSLDGFAHLPNDFASIGGIDWEGEATEILSTRKRGKIRKME